MKQLREDYGADHPLLNPGSPSGKSGQNPPGMPGQSGATKPAQPPNSPTEVRSPNGAGGTSRDTTKEPGGSMKTQEPGGSVKGAEWISKSESHIAAQERDKLILALEDPSKFYSPDGSLKEVGVLAGEAALRT